MNSNINHAYCIQGNLQPRLFSPLSPSLSAGKFKSGEIPISQIISLFTQLHLAEFRAGQIISIEGLKKTHKPLYNITRVYFKLCILFNSFIFCNPFSVWSDISFASMSKDVLLPHLQMCPIYMLCTRKHKTRKPWIKLLFTIFPRKSINKIFTTQWTHSKHINFSY